MVNHTLCGKCHEINFTMVLHFQTRKNERQLYKILQSKVVYGDAKECMDDKLSIQRFFILHKKKLF